MTDSVIPFALVDVFTDRPLEGNPLALVPDADELPETLMRRIAGEFNQAETTFLLRPTQNKADWRLRSFTAAGVEVFGAGHNALGAWWWLAATDRLVRHSPTDSWHQEIGSAVLPVTVTARPGGVIDVSMRQQTPEYGEELTDIRELADALNVDRNRLGAANDLPVAQVVSTGAAHLMVGLRDRHTVDSASPDAASLRELLPDVGGQGVYLYSLDPVEEDAHAHTRFVNPVAGITEDPATGSAAGPLASLLRRHGRVGDRVSIIQGHTMGRPSRIQVTTDGQAPHIIGRAALAATGQMHVNY
ncbi:PhzF family phenazine biosynthesis protein [Streptomyces werraensis]|uniref:PhzF family phenazine biosynthesis protein n=1 Tax=Streptomyces werraensis TaxID=68284 RepID=UPI0037F8250F